MTVTATLEECDILFCDTAIKAPDGRGGEATIQPLFCTVCGRAWVPNPAEEKPPEGIWGWTTRLLKQFEAKGEKCPFCLGSHGFRFKSPRVEGHVHKKRTEWFQLHPVQLDVPTTHSFIFRSGHEAHTVGEFLTYAVENWDVAQGHFAEGHMEQWLRAVGHKEIAAIFRENRQLLGDEQAAFERCISLLKEYGALEPDF